MMSELVKVFGLYSTLWRLIALATTAFLGLVTFNFALLDGTFDWASFDQSKHGLLATLLIVCIYALVEIGIYGIRKSYDYFATINRAKYRILKLLTPSSQRMLYDAFNSTSSTLVKAQENPAIRLLMYHELIREVKAPSFGATDSIDYKKPWSYILPLPTRVALQQLKNMDKGDFLVLEKSMHQLRSEQLKKFLESNYSDDVLNENGDPDPLHNSESIVLKIKLQAEVDDDVIRIPDNKLVIFQSFAPKENNGKVYRVSSRAGSRYAYMCVDEKTGAGHARFHPMYLTPIDEGNP